MLCNSAKCHGILLQAILDKFVEGWIVQWWNQKHVGLLVVDAAEANRLMADVIMCWVLCCDAVSVWCHYVLSIVLWHCERVMSLCAEYCAAYAVSVWCHYMLSIVLQHCERVMSLCAEYCAVSRWCDYVLRIVLRHCEHVMSLCAIDCDSEWVSVQQLSMSAACDRVRVRFSIVNSLFEDTFAQFENTEGGHEDTDDDVTPHVSHGQRSTDSTVHTVC